jgi:hypothetical protein
VWSGGAKHIGAGVGTCGTREAYMMVVVKEDSVL